MRERARDRLQRLRVPASSWEIKATPTANGSHVEMLWVREFKPGPRGRLFGTLFRLVGKRLFTKYAQDVLTNLARLEQNERPHEPHDPASDRPVELASTRSIQERLDESRVDKYGFETIEGGVANASDGRQGPTARRIIGIVFVVIGVIAIFLPGAPPKAAEVSKIAGYFIDKRGSILASNFLTCLAFGLFLLFVGALRSYLVVLITQACDPDPPCSPAPSWP